MNPETAALTITLALYAAVSIVQAFEAAADREARANPQWQAQQVAAYNLKGR
jgi:hypothetical protein